MVQENGPLSFVVKEDGSPTKFKVRIGETQSCSCTHPDLCIHVLFVMLKVLRVPEDSPLLWQLALVQSEITQILYHRFERVRRPAVAPSEAPKEGGAVERRPLEEGDACPICQEDMQEGEVLTYCTVSCGNNVHAKCMKVWAEHRASLEEPVTCPLCRKNWGSTALKDIKSEIRRAQPTHVHLKVACAACSATPIYGVCYRCLACEVRAAAPGALRRTTPRMLTTPAPPPAGREPVHALLPARLAPHASLRAACRHGGEVAARAAAAGARAYTLGGCGGGGGGGGHAGARARWRADTCYAGARGAGRAGGAAAPRADRGGLRDAAAIGRRTARLPAALPHRVPPRYPPLRPPAGPQRCRLCAGRRWGGRCRYRCRCRRRCCCRA